MALQVFVFFWSFARRGRVGVIRLDWIAWRLGRSGSVVGIGDWGLGGREMPGEGWR